MRVHPTQIGNLQFKEQGISKYKWQIAKLVTIVAFLILGTIGVTSLYEIAAGIKSPLASLGLMGASAMTGLSFGGMTGLFIMQCLITFKDAPRPKYVVNGNQVSFIANHQLQLNKSSHEFYTYLATVYATPVNSADQLRHDLI